MDLKYDLALLLATAVWSVTFVVVKGALADASPLALVSVRFALAALAAFTLGRGALPTRAEWRVGAPLGVLLFLGFAFQVAGLEHTTPSRSGFVTGLAVVIVPILGRLFYGAHTPVATWFGALVAAAGLAALSGVLTGDAATATLGGDALTLVCAAAFAMQILYMGRHTSALRVMPGLVVQTLTVAVLAALASPLVETPRFAATPRLWGALVFLALFPTVLTVSIQMWAQRHTPAARAALIFALEPVFAAAFSAACGEKLGPREYAGGALIVAGVVVSELPWSTLWRPRVSSASP